MSAPNGLLTVHELEAGLAAWPHELNAEPVSAWTLPWPAYVRAEEVPAALVLPPLLL